MNHLCNATLTPSISHHGFVNQHRSFKMSFKLGNELSVSNALHFVGNAWQSNKNSFIFFHPHTNCRAKSILQNNSLGRQHCLRSIEIVNWDIHILRKKFFNMIQNILVVYQMVIKKFTKRSFCNIVFGRT